MIEASKIKINKIIKANKLHIQARSYFILYNVIYLDECYTIRISKNTKKSSVKKNICIKKSGKNGSVKEYINGKIVYKKR